MATGYSTSLRGKSMSGGIMGQLVGDWALLKRLTETQHIFVIKAAEAASLNVANNFKAFIIKKIEGGLTDYGFPSYSSGYSRYKKWAGSSEGFFLFTGSYVNSIKAHYKSRGGIKFYTVGIPWDAQPQSNLPGGQDRKSTMPIAKYAQILEVGLTSRNIPPRPLWRKSFQKFGGSKKVKTEIVAGIVAALRGMGIRAKVSF